MMHKAWSELARGLAVGQPAWDPIAIPYAALMPFGVPVHTFETILPEASWIFIELVVSEILVHLVVVVDLQASSQVAKFPPTARHHEWALHQFISVFEIQIKPLRPYFTAFQSIFGTFWPKCVLFKNA